MNSIGSEERKYVLAIDHGTSGVKSTIMSVYGELVDFEFQSTPVHFLPGGGAEQDPEEWWQALLGTCKKLVSRNPQLRNEIVAICVSSTFSSTVAVDKNGEHICPSLTWMDSRGASYIQKVMRGRVNLLGYGISNILRWVPKTGGAPSLSGKDDIAHILYWKYEMPEVYEKAYMFLESKDYLNLRLCGEFSASYDSIQLFWLTDIRDINNIHYDEALIKRIGIDRDKLPPLKPAVSILGQLKKSVAEEIGVSPEVKVITGSADLQSASVGSGAVRDFEPHIYIGTSSWILSHLPYKKTDVFHNIASLPSSIPGRYFSANEQDSAGGCLAFLADNILFQKPEFQKPKPEQVYKIFDEVVEKTPAGSNGVIFTPWLNGERSPVDDHRLRGGFYNLSVDNTVGDLIRAVFEGVAFNSRWLFGYLEKFVGRRIPALNMIGGGAQSDVWCQIYADVLGREIRQVKDPLQSNARGACFIAGVALGYINFEQIPDLVKYKKIYQPNPKNQKLYDQLFKTYLEIYRRMRKIYHRLNKAD